MLTRVVSAEGFKPSELIRLAADQALGVTLVTPPSGHVDTPLFAGRLLSQEIQPGLRAAADDITYLTSDSIQSEAEPAVMCGVLLDGGPETMQVVGYGPITRYAERPALFGFRERTRFELSGMMSHRSRSAGFVIKPEFFDRFGDTIKSDGLAALREFVRTDFRFESLPRSPKVVDIARRSLDHPYGDQLGELFLESNTLSFVIEIAQLLAHERRMIAAIGKRHYDRVVEARDILDANLVAPPKILELTKRVGVNLTTLQANFKTVFGTTIFGYVRMQRLQMARVLLREYHLTVAETGYRVGFVSPSAFTAAYRRYFGHPPGQDISRERE
ncbi:AraC family transcriptional regulator [Hyphomicrobium sp. CS1GBMeth3]|uniref:helix-turn-helix transcriptional regulator n=1 Tax=Hyphomicrobium sp. CS1GBMeth3 TaxID=1892845 RepID=UPI000930C8F7|nr:AraC family transcriptional regulator [Hyphomicrobium sp. CS1GBMeth3]